MNHKVAVVEDNPDNRMLVQALLEDRYHLSEYETGVEAVEGVFKLIHLRHGAVAIARIVRRHDVITIRQRGDQIAKHV